MSAALSSPLERFFRRRRAPLWPLAAAAFVALAACADRSAQMREQDVQQQSEFAQRRAGETRLAPVADVAKDLGCGTSRARMARIERAEVLPVRPQPGREINHRFIYSACDAGAAPVSGLLIRRLYFARRVIYEEKIPATLRPGRWAVDVMVGIPPAAEPGWYGVEVTFQHATWPLYNWQWFQLVAKPPGG